MERLVVAVFLAAFALERAVLFALAALDLREIRRRGAEVPPQLAGRVDAAEAARRRDYALARAKLGLGAGAWGAALTLAALLGGLLPALDARLAAAGLAGPHLFAAFLALLAGAGWVAFLPFSIHRTFAVEARFGFNRTTPALWLADRAKGLAMAAALGVPLLYAAHALFARAGPAWWLWLFGLLACVEVALAWLGPSLIAPLFNRYAPLPPGPLRARLEELCRDAGFRTRGLFAVDASRRSGHANAFFAGLFRPRIVLFDTLVAGTPVDEAAAILAHEIGHYRARDTLRGLLLGLAGQLAGLYALSLLAAWPPAFRAFGFPGPSLHAAAALAALCGGSFTFVLEPLGAFLSRRRERAADRYAVRLTGEPLALASALRRLGERNLSSLWSHPWSAAWHHSHPALPERIAAIERAAGPPAPPAPSP